LLFLLKYTDRYFFGALYYFIEIINHLCQWSGSLLLFQGEYIQRIGTKWKMLNIEDIYIYSVIEI
jgi:hypothetical protein